MRTHIEFYPDGWEWRDARQLRKRPVEGVGTNDVDYATKIWVEGGRLFCPAYVSWSDMLKRCYNKNYHQDRPSYLGVACHKSWLSFSNFRRWYFRHRENINSFRYTDQLNLDKDILSNSKTYGPSTCLLITPILNSLLLDSGAVRGKYPIGVTKCQGKFRAQVSLNGKVKSKRFDTPEEAAEYRLQMKLEHVRTFPLPPWLDESIVRPRLIEIVKNQR